MFIFKNKLSDVISENVERAVEIEVSKRLRNLSEQQTICRDDGKYYRHESVYMVIKQYTQEITESVVREIKEEFNKETFIDSIIDRINRKQIK